MRRALAFLVLLTACGGGGGGGPSGPVADVIETIGTSGGTVTTTDGKLSLEIPAGALAAETEISIRPITKADLGPDFADVDVEGAWEMGPDGLEFLTPVTVTRVIDESPLRADGSMEVSPVVLLSLSDACNEYAGEQELTGEANTGTMEVTGTIAHFSRLVSTRTGVSFEVTGVPDALPEGSTFFADMKVARENTRFDISGVRFSSDETRSPVEAPADDPTAYTLDSDGQVTVSEGPYDCSSVGHGTFAARADLIGMTPEDFLSLFGIGSADANLDYRLRVEKRVTCAGPPPSARTYDLAITKLEGLTFAYGYPWPDEEDPPRPLVTVSGENEVSFVDTDTGEEVQTLPTLAGFNYGVLPLTGGVPHLFAFGSYGAQLWAHRTDKSLPWFGDGAFGNAVVESRENVTDASPMSNGGLLFCENSAGRIRFLDPDGPGYSVSSTYVGLANVVSAVETSDGSFLAVTDGYPGALYSIADRNSPPVMVGEVGAAPRRVRVIDDLAVCSYYGDGVAFGGVRTAKLANAAWGFIDGIVGIRPVGIDLLALPNGHVGLAATSYDDDTLNLMEIDTSGSILSNDATELPSGCKGPGHVAWLYVPGASEYAQLAISCHISEVIALIPFLLQ